MLGHSLLRRFSMEATLAHSIRYAVWGDVWTNSQQDDIVINVARFLQWQALFPGRKNEDRPFHDNNLFALLFLGLIPQFFLSKSPNDKGKWTGVLNAPSLGNLANIVNMVRQSAMALIQGLSKAERAEYNAFQKRYLDMYVTESQRQANN
jgi:hypothetical protein